MILMIDNYDSFTFNLVQYLKMLGESVEVHRNDALTIDQIRTMNPEMIVISPGPCTPNEAGISVSVVEQLSDEFPILGICLGHQIIAQAFGAKIVHALAPVHGKVHPITHDGKGVFKGLKNPLNVTRYHSLIVDKKSLPEDFIITSTTAEGEIMGIRHKYKLIEGIQFHPEAILTEHGIDMLRNFLYHTREAKKNDYQTM
ncbi:aminodeoxychorismate/anthranilate synthase component II [Tepidibacillus infernus]|uniref:Anthranilate synthase n=1 Tax=Tepidibacillus decaturensis TaxID=1413211 RepID=A0A135L2V3_9BACI|nr:aminodeoxychorismate/anthranilate synthase component II [Tepidibacillus decaturensis]KXG43227.1 anthranilate synthase [Tepidibacillus decaturensis]